MNAFLILQSAHFKVCIFKNTVTFFDLLPSSILLPCVCLSVYINPPKLVKSPFLLLLEVFLDTFLNCVLDAYHARGGCILCFQ